MARPTKSTVDYFPHNTEHDATLYILESRWGNDGFAVWFKLRERLGCSDGLYIDCRNVADWQYLAAYTRVSSRLLSEILTALAELNAIDADLWERFRVIYCQEYVDGVLDAFRKRKEAIPTREKVIAAANLDLSEFPPEKPPKIGVSDAGNGEREREREREREISTEGLGFPSFEDKDFYACGKVDNSVQSADETLMEGQKRLVEKRKEGGVLVKFPDPHKAMPP